MRNRFYPGLILLLVTGGFCFPLVAAVNESIPSSIQKQPGLQSAVFETPSGTIKVNLPDDMSASDTLSGTVVVEPKGSTPEEIAQNADELNGYVVEVQKAKTVAFEPVPLISAGWTPAGNDTGHGGPATEAPPAMGGCRPRSNPPGTGGCRPKNNPPAAEGCRPKKNPGAGGRSNGTAGNPVPAGCPSSNNGCSRSGTSSQPGNDGGSRTKWTNIIMTLGTVCGGIDIVLNRGSRGTCRQSIGCLPVPPVAPTSCTLPTRGTCGTPLVVKGPCDGRFSNSRIRVGGRTCTMVAESPRQQICLSPGTVVGSCQIECTEGKRVTRGNFLNLPARNASSKQASGNSQPAAIVTNLSGRWMGGSEAFNSPVDVTQSGNQVTFYIQSSKVQFTGTLQGSRIDFRWQNPSNPSHHFEGFLICDPTGHELKGEQTSTFASAGSSHSGTHQLLLTR